MKSNYDQLNIEYSETDKESYSVRIISWFLIIIFMLVPLAEIVTDLHYNSINYQATTSFCANDLDLIDNVLSFKEIK